MMRNIKLILMLLVLFFVAAWPFHTEKFAIEKTNKYRVIANGWVSMYAHMHMSDKMTWTEKIRQTISTDFIHGRFRPAFFFYVTSSYALSPLIHGRSPTAEGRPYRELMNGDLQFFSFILLATLSASAVLMSILIYRYTGEIIYAILPAAFIPLSQTLTFNFLADVIDSQEIPLIFCLSLWTAALFAAMSVRGKVLAAGFFTVSLFALFIAFIVKETIVSICISLFFIVLLYFVFKQNVSSQDSLGKRNGKFILSSFLFSCLCSVVLLAMIFNHKKGYADGYKINDHEQLKLSVKALWIWMSSYSLHNIFGHPPVLLSLYISAKNRDEKLFGVLVINHFFLLVLLLSVSYSFLFILLPWNPLGVKYVLPSVFFFSFAVAFSLSFLTAWAKEKYGRRGIFVYLFMIIHLFLYFSYRVKSEKEKEYLTELGSYGASISGQLAESIYKNAKLNKNLLVFVDYGDQAKYGSPVKFGKLHLMRLLNLDMMANIIKKDGGKILNFKMPVYELSSFIDHKNGINIHISDKKEELDKFKFDVIYFGYNKGDEPLKKVKFNGSSTCYNLTDEHINYKSPSGFFKDFSIYKYLPCSIRNI